MALNELGFLWSLKRQKQQHSHSSRPRRGVFERNPISGVEFELRAVTRERHSPGPHPAPNPDSAPRSERRFSRLVPLDNHSSS
jgi:hypothetical protein